MVTSWLDREIVWLKIEGEFRADEIIAETNRWLQERRDDYVGYIVDVREMTKRTSIEQQKVEEAAKRNQSGKVRAVLGRDAVFGILVNIYIRFTNAQGISYFVDEEQARTWIMSFKRLGANSNLLNRVDNEDY